MFISSEWHQSHTTYFYALPRLFKEFVNTNLEVYLCLMGSGLGLILVCLLMSGRSLFLFNVYFIFETIILIYNEIYFYFKIILVYINVNR